MNINEYISSGIIELYVLGQLDPAEAKEVESMAAKHPEVATEISAVQAALLAVAETNAQAPSPDLESRIMDQFDEKPTASPEPKSGGNGLRNVLSVLLLVSLVGLLFLFQKNNSQEKELEKTRTELEQLKSDCDEVQKNSQRAIAYIDKINADGNASITMTDENGNEAVVHWNKETRKTFLEIKNLNTPPAGKQYQLWAIVDGAPTDMGVFDISTDALALTEVPHFENPQAFAVSLENEGGSPVPTQVVMIQNI